MYRHHPRYKTIKDIIKSGEIGAIRGYVNGEKRIAPLANQYAVQVDDFARTVLFIKWIG